MQYSELVTSVQQYCEGYEAKFVASIPTFVKNAERRIYNEVQLPAIRNTAILAVDPTDVAAASYLLPADFLAPFSLAMLVAGNRTYLLQKDFEYLREAYPNDTQTDFPIYYAMADSFEQTQLRIRLAPCPNAVAQTAGYELKYYAQPESIVTATTTWLGDNFDGALLWGSIVEGYVFLKGEPDLIQTYEGKFQQQLALLKQLGDGKDRQDTYRVPQTKVAVT